jgi:hypothetical protein
MKTFIKTEVKCKHHGSSTQTYSKVFVIYHFYAGNTPPLFSSFLLFIFFFQKFFYLLRFSLFSENKIDLMMLTFFAKKRREQTPKKSF